MEENIENVERACILIKSYSQPEFGILSCARTSLSCYCVLAFLLILDVTALSFTGLLLQGYEQTIFNI